MTAEPYAAIPVRECAPWCTTARAVGHEDEHPHDRLCYSDIKAVVLSRREVVKIHDRVWAFDSVDVVMRRPADQDEAVIVLNDETHGLETELTTPEARQLMVAISSLLDLES